MEHIRIHMYIMHIYFQIYVDINRSSILLLNVHKYMMVNAIGIHIIDIHKDERCDK